MNQFQSIPETSFKSDGCSGGLTKIWKKTTKYLFHKEVVPPFNDCCISHDIEYHWGGTKAERLQADIDLFKCSWPISKFWSVVMFIAVRIGGGPHWNTDYRWGYGRPVNTPYEEGS